MTCRTLTRMPSKCFSERVSSLLKRTGAGNGTPAPGGYQLVHHGAVGKAGKDRGGYFQPRADGQSALGI